MRTKRNRSSASSAVHTAPTLQEYMWAELTLLLKEQAPPLGVPHSARAEKKFRQVMSGLTTAKQC